MPRRSSNSQEAGGSVTAAPQGIFLERCTHDKKGDTGVVILLLMHHLVRDCSQQLEIGTLIFIRYVTTILTMQLPLFPRGTLAALTRAEHGGDVGRGRHKGARPFSSRRPLHVVMRSDRAVGDWSMLCPVHRATIANLMRTLAPRYRVRVYQFANVGNHLHFVVGAKDRHGFQSFLRAFAGLAARAVTGARKGAPVGRFWTSTTYSRLLSWGRAFHTARVYVLQNEFESAGFPTPRVLERRGRLAGSAASRNAGPTS
jgi:REP element-mobilizing transposase RayT